MSRSEWFDGPTGPDDGSARPEGSDGGAERPRPAHGSPAAGTARHDPPRAAGAGRHRRHRRRRAHRRVVVRVGRLPRRVRQGADDQAQRSSSLAAVITGAAVAASLVVAYRTRPLYIPVTPAQQVLEQYRQAIEPLRRVAVMGRAGRPRAARRVRVDGRVAHLPALGSTASRSASRTPSSGSTSASSSSPCRGCGSSSASSPSCSSWRSSPRAFTHYVYGGLQLPGRGPTTRAAYVHLGILGALIALTRAASYWLDRYSLSTQKGSLLTGITYTDDKAVLPTKAILAVAALMCAGFFLAAIWSRSWRLPDHRRRAARRHRGRRGRRLPGADPVAQGQPVAEVARGASTSSATSTPPERRSGSTGSSASRTPPRPRPRTRPSCAPPPTTSPACGSSTPTSSRPRSASSQAQRDYYAFPDTLDVDRYTIDKQTRDAVVAVREINLEGLPDGQRNWLNDHTVYTHGYGFYAAYGNQRTTEGDPVFFEGGGLSAHRRVRAARSTSASCRPPTPWSARRAGRPAARVRLPRRR